MAMTLRTDEQLDRVLDALAAAHGVSKQVIVTQAVMEPAGYLRTSRYP